MKWTQKFKNSYIQNLWSDAYKYGKISLKWTFEHSLLINILIYTFEG